MMYPLDWLFGYSNLSAIHHLFQASIPFLDRYLANRAKSGRPAKADDYYLAEVEHALDTDPRELGYAFSVWTINKLRKHLEKQTGILLSYTRFRALLSKHDYVYRQPKHDLSDLQDADAKAAAEEFLNWLKKSPSPDLPLSSSLWTKQA
jgi:hypothetical protein